MTSITPPAALAGLTTLRVGGPATRVVEARTREDLIAAVAEADAAGEQVLLVAGGSNLLVADAGFAGTVVLIRTFGVDVDASADVANQGEGRVVVTAQAGVDWDGLVALTVERGLAGMEALSGIPGSVGATPVQNVGAYGQEVADTVVSVDVWDRRAGATRTLSAADCGFGYRTSVFKGRDDLVVLAVRFALRPGGRSAPVRYAELARRLGVEVGEQAGLSEVRDTVLGLRAGKGMVLDPADHDTWSAGSFFTNPVIAAEAVPEGAPAWPQPDGRVKTSAAWLIEHAGFGRGHGLPGPASLSTKHTLALTNRGQARAEDLLALAREVRDGVQARFGITLVNEPVMVGCSLS